MTSKASKKKAKISVEAHNLPSALTRVLNYPTLLDLLLDHEITVIIVGGGACITISEGKIDALTIRWITFLLRLKELLCLFSYVISTIVMSFISFHLNSITIKYCLSYGLIF